DGRYECSQQLVVDLWPGDHTAGRGAVLPGVEVAGDRDPLGHGIQVRVIEHDDRRLAAELQVDALQGVGRVLGDQLARGGVTGERDYPHVLVSYERVADRQAVAGHAVEHARREDVGGEL